jgi:hypothetical protein
MPATRTSARIAANTANGVKTKANNIKGLLIAAKTKVDNGFDLSTKLSKKSEDLIAKNMKDEETYKIVDEDWIEFFCDFIDYIHNNIDLCLSKIHGLNHLKIEHLYKVNLSAGGFDDDFNNDLKHNYNIGLYEELFRQFKDGTNKLNKCHRINLLLTYIGAAVLQIADNYKRTSKNELIEFYRKIAVILELAVYPEIFLHYMTGDSTGHTHNIDGKFKGQSKYNKYMGIWIRKQEYLGIITHNRKDYWKKFDSGLRLFIRNYIRRLIVYMRTYNISYPLGYELPYNYSAHPDKVLKNPLPYNGVYVYSTPIDYYYINFDDWEHIPNILLPRIARQTSLTKSYISPDKWKNPPPDWWIIRVLKLFDDVKWWDISVVRVEEMSRDLEGSKQLAKWIKLNGILPQQYDNMSELWDAEYEDEAEYHGEYNGGSISKSFKNKRHKKHFKIVSDKDIALDPLIRKELKLKFKEYFKLNIVKDKKNKEGYLRDGTYIDNLNTSILYSMDKNLPHDKILKNNATIRILNAVV